MLAEVWRLAEIVAPRALSFRVGRDVDGDAALAAGAASRADLIISGDADLLVLISHAGIPIGGPAEATARVGD